MAVPTTSSRIARKNIGDQFRINAESSTTRTLNALAHAIPKRNCAREARENCWTFRINTTVPSPRIEAPLTDRWHNIGGERFDHQLFFPYQLVYYQTEPLFGAPITMTKLFFEFFTGSTA